MLLPNLNVPRLCSFTRRSPRKCFTASQGETAGDHQPWRGFSLRRYTSRPSIGRVNSPAGHCAGVLPLAIVGIVIACCAKGYWKVAGLTMNLTMVIPALIVFVGMIRMTTAMNQIKPQNIQQIDTKGSCRRLSHRQHAKPESEQEVGGVSPAELPLPTALQNARPLRQG